MSSKTRYVSALLVLSAIAALILLSCSDVCEVCPELSETFEITIPAAEYGEMVDAISVAFKTSGKFREGRTRPVYPG